MVVVFAFLISSTIVQAETVDVPVTATVAQASLTLVKADDLDFGDIVVPAAGGNSTVTLVATGDTTTPEVTAGEANISGGGRGVVNVTSPITASVNISYAIVSDTSGGAGTGAANAIQIVTGENAGATMAVANIAGNSTAGPIELTALVQSQIYIGGELTVPSGQAAGDYSGICTVTVEYQ